MFISVKISMERGDSLYFLSLHWVERCVPGDVLIDGEEPQCDNHPLRQEGGAAGPLSN